MEAELRWCQALSASQSKAVWGVCYRDFFPLLFTTFGVLKWFSGHGAPRLKVGL